MTTIEERSSHGPEAPAPTPSPTPAPASPGSTFETLAVAGFIFGMFSLFIAIFALGLAGRAVSEARDAGDGGGGGAATAEVAMHEFAFDPGELEVAVGAVLTLHNEGAVVHNLSVDGVASEMVEAGASGELDLTGVGAGTYEMRCDVPGHAEAGMVGTVTVG